MRAAERKLGCILSQFRVDLQSLVVVLSLISSWPEGKAVMGSCPAGEGWVGGWSEKGWRHLWPRGPRGLETEIPPSEPPSVDWGGSHLCSREKECVWGA